MSTKETTDAMILLQDKMTSLQVKEAAAYERKIQAENEIAACGSYWYSLYQKYSLLKAELEKQK